MRKTTTIAKAPTVEAKAKRKKKNFLSADEFWQFVDENSRDGISANLCVQSWNGESLKEDKVYHMKDMAGLRLDYIGISFKDVKKEWKAIKQFGMMLTPAVVVSARERDEFNTRFPIPSEELEELNGIYSLFCPGDVFVFFAWLYDLAYTSKYGGEPFDFNFVFKHLSKKGCTENIE